jgi:hypothetical protein
VRVHWTEEAASKVTPWGRRRPGAPPRPSRRRTWDRLRGRFLRRREDLERYDAVDLDVVRAALPAFEDERVPDALTPEVWAAARLGAAFRRTPGEAIAFGLSFGIEEAVELWIAASGLQMHYGVGRIVFEERRGPLRADRRLRRALTHADDATYEAARARVQPWWDDDLGRQELLAVFPEEREWALALLERQPRNAPSAARTLLRSALPSSKAKELAHRAPRHDVPFLDLLARHGPAWVLPMLLHGQDDGPLRNHEEDLRPLSIVEAPAVARAMVGSLGSGALARWATEYALRFPGACRAPLERAARGKGRAASRATEVLALVRRADDRGAARVEGRFGTLGFSNALLAPPVDGDGVPSSPRRVEALLDAMRRQDPDAAATHRATLDAETLDRFVLDVAYCWHAGRRRARDRWMWDQLARFAAGSTWQAASFGVGVDLLDVLERAGTPAARLELARIADGGRRWASAALTALGDEPEADLDLGLDGDGGAWVDYGARRFRVGFRLRGGGALAPFVTSEAGRPYRSLPRAAKADDPAAALRSQTRWRRLKKDMELWLRRQTVALERALREGRRWPWARFRERYVDSALGPGLITGLVLDVDGRLARLEGRSLVDLEGRSVDAGSVAIAHPRALAGVARRWAEDLADHRLVPLLRQLDREPPRPPSEQERARYRLLRESAGRLPRADLAASLVALGGSPEPGGIRLPLADDDEARIRIDLAPRGATVALELESFRRPRLTFGDLPTEEVTRALEAADAR